MRKPIFLVFMMLFLVASVGVAQDSKSGSGDSKKSTTEAPKTAGDQDKKSDTGKSETKSQEDKKSDDAKSGAAKSDEKKETGDKKSDGKAAVVSKDGYEYQDGDYRPGDYWFPEKASTFAGEVDWLFYFIFWVCVFFFVIIIGVMIGFVVKFRKRPGHEAPIPSPSHNTTLEILWSVLPSFLLVFMFVAGTSGYFKQRIPPDDAYEIYVEASQFSWAFETEEGDITQDLHLVVNQPFRLKMQSKDVLHSMFVPAFRQKMDVVPGRFAEFWVTPTKEGTFRLYCTEYCGDGHSLMARTVHVHKDWKTFRENVLWDPDTKTPEENGERLYKINCAGCHTIDGSAKTGPSFLGLWGREESMIDGSTKLVDEQYVIDSIWEPQKDVVAGYGPRSQMASFKGKISEKEINYIIEYLKTLKEE